MAIITRYLLLPCLLFLASATVAAQQELRPSTLEYLEQHELEWKAPEAAYRLRWPSREDYHETLFGVRLRKQKVDVFYEFIPTAADSNFVPHVRTATLAIHLASNEEDAYLAAHDVDPMVIDTVYNADWAQTFFFPPKDGFNLYKDCQMTAIYRDGVGMAIIYLLFDEAPLELESFAQSLRFVPLIEEDEK